MDIVVNAYKTKRLFQGSGLSTNTTKMLEDPARARPGYDVAHSAAIFEIISSLKHSCRPAGFYVWNDALKAGTVQATRDIDLGETICISWLNDLCQDVEDRQKVLASMRGIEKCNCGVCCGFADRSDLRRRQVAAASARQAKGKMSQEEQARLRTIVMRLLDDEGLGTSAHMLYWYVPS